MSEVIRDVNGLLLRRIEAMRRRAADRYAAGDRAGAVRIAEQVAELAREGLGVHSLVHAESLDDVAFLYEDVGRYDEAETLYLRAAEVVLDGFGDAHPAYATYLNNVAVLYTTLGRYDDAERLLRQVLHLHRRERRDRYPAWATAASNLAGVYEALGRREAAEELYRRAMAVDREVFGEDHPAYGTDLYKLASLYVTTDCFPEAEPMMERAAEIIGEVLGEDAPEYAECLDRLATIHEWYGEVAEAERLFSRAAEIYRDARGDGAPELAAVLNNLGNLYLSQRRLGEAEPLLLQATEMDRRTLGEGHPEFATNLHNLAVLYEASGRSRDARDAMRRASEIDDRTLSWVSSMSSERHRMAYLASIERNYHGHLSLLLRHHTGPASDVANAALDLVLWRKGLGTEALALQRDAARASDDPEVAATHERWAALRRTIAEGRLAGPGGGDPERYEASLAALDREREDLEVELARRVPRLDLERRLRASTRGPIAGLLPEGAALVEFVRLPVVDVDAAPARGEPVPSLMRYVALVLSSGRPDDVAMVDLGDAEAIDRLVREFRDDLVSGDGGARDVLLSEAASERAPASAAGRELRALAFDPLRRALGHARRLLIAPDGALTRLPFGVLPDGRGRHLADGYRFSYLSTGRDVVRFGEAPRGGGSAPASAAVIVAAPDFDLAEGQPSPPGTGSRGGRGRAASDPGPGAVPSEMPPHEAHVLALRQTGVRFSPLPGTRLEGDRVAEILGCRPWLADHALESRLRAVRSPRVLHIATHGFFFESTDQRPDAPMGDADVPPPAPEPVYGRGVGGHLNDPLLRSGLALAGANTWVLGGETPAEAEDGLLTAEDVAGLDLLGTELVVLSACDTALGDVRAGEGVYGLQRAFMVAGVRTLVMSLWKVPDLATAVLMVRFYQGLCHRRLGRADALQAAQRYVRDVTVGELRAEWLSGTAPGRAAEVPFEIRRELDRLAAGPDGHRPFRDPLYWGAFICQGDPRPLPVE